MANMKKLWTWLKENQVQVETKQCEDVTVDVISLPEGLYWPTKDSPHLFVRQCDKDLYDLVMGCNTRLQTGALVLGNPGIGEYNPLLPFSSQQARVGFWPIVFIDWSPMKRHETSPSFMTQCN